MSSRAASMILIPLMVCVTGLLAGCVRSDKGRVVAPETMQGQYKARWPTLGRGPQLFLHLAVGPDRAGGCTIPDPHFFYDSSKLRAQDANAIQALAECLTSPEHQSKTIVLTGHADPRGNAQYNENLAATRAQQVADLLESEGVDGNRIVVASMGEQQAVGNLPQYSFGYDRRVDITFIALHAPTGPRGTENEPVLGVPMPTLPAVQTDDDWQRLFPIQTARSD